LRVLVATTNPDKLREIRGLLSGAPVELSSLADLPDVAEPEETGGTFRDNARLKALYYDRHRAAHSGSSGRDQPRVLTVAEDSGLVIDGLDGEPGVRSARFLGAEASYAQRFDEILRRLGTDRSRRARFVCALCVVRNGEIVFETEGTVEGEIAQAPSGTAGFGYDPIFYFPPYGSTLADVTEAEKLRVAHRGEAFRAFATWLGDMRTENQELSVP
jgi:XTP/dITP diphosphohydrolase